MRVFRHVDVCVRNTVSWIGSEINRHPGEKYEVFVSMIKEGNIPALRVEIINYDRPNVFSIDNFGLYRFPMSKNYSEARTAAVADGIETALSNENIQGTFDVSFDKKA